MNASSIKEDVCLWIDGVGGYVICSADAFQFGASTSRVADASVFADLPEHAFSIATIAESCILEPITRAVNINGRLVERPTVLKSNDRIDVGQVSLLYRRPNPFSRTAILTLASRHRWNHHVDGVILMSHCCLIGNTTHAHIFNPHSDMEWMLTKDKDAWGIASRSADQISSDRRQKQALMPMRRFKGEGIQLTLTVERREH
jgi:hypothetical protein